MAYYAPQKVPLHGLAYTLVQMHQHGPNFIFMHWDVLQPFNNLNPGLSIGYLGWTHLCKAFFVWPICMYDKWRNRMMEMSCCGLDFGLKNPA